MFVKKVFKNGLTAIVSPSPSTQAVTVLVMVKVGSRYESPATNGIAHFTEHLLFKGTKRRPNTQIISQELDAVGADYNAFTGKEYTGYYIKVDGSHLALAIDMLADMLQHSLFAESEIQREKGVIIEEINMYEDAPMMMIEDVFDQGAYEKNSLGWNVAGSKETVSSFERRDFMKFFHTHYHPGNMLVSIAGQVDPENAWRLLAKAFRARSQKRSGSYRPYRIVQRQVQLHVKAKATEQVHLALGFVGRVNYQSQNYLPLKIGSAVLGGNMSSRLFINIRERQGLCYYIRSRVNAYQDVGNFTVYAGLDKSRITLAVKLIKRELDRLADRGISVAELKKAKEYMKGKTVLALEDSAAVAQWFAERWLFSKTIETPDQYLRKVVSVSRSHVNGSLQRLLNGRYLNLAIIGQIEQSEKLIKLL